MCTASWLSFGRGYELLFNRDELRTRPSALPPRRSNRQGVRYLAPVDPVEGGSWIAVNEFGLCLFLLNRRIEIRTEPPGTAGVMRSRGALPIELIASERTSDAIRALEALDLSRFRPFTLAAIAPDAPALARGWDGRRLFAVVAEPPLVSSSLLADELLADRAAALPSPEQRTLRRLLAFQRSHLPARSARSVCMHRDDAETVSFTRVRVDPARIHLGYAPGPPCQRAPLSWRTLARRSMPSALAAADRAPSTSAS